MQAKPATPAAALPRVSVDSRGDGPDNVARPPLEQEAPPYDPPPALDKSISDESPNMTARSASEWIPGGQAGHVHQAAAGMPWSAHHVGPDNTAWHGPEHLLNPIIFSSSYWSGSGHPAAEPRNGWPGVDTATVIVDKWNKISRQRRVVSGHRKKMLEAIASIDSIRRQKGANTAKLEKLELSQSARRGKPAPQAKRARLAKRSQVLESDLASMHSSYIAMGEKLDQLMAKQESFEADFFRTFSALNGLPVPVDGPVSGPVDSTHQNRTSSSAHHPTWRRTPGQTGQPDQSGHGSGVLATGSRPSAVDLMVIGISSERPTDSHPLFSLLLRCISELNLAQEHHAEIFAERDDILSELQTRFLLHLNQLEEMYDRDALQRFLHGDSQSPTLWASFIEHLTESDLVFLAGFEDMEKAALANIEARKLQVERLRAVCTERGLMPSLMHYRDSLSVFEVDAEEAGWRDIGSNMKNMTWIYERVSVVKNETYLEHWRFPNLLTNPQHVLMTPPMTAEQALRWAMKLPEDYPNRLRLTEMYIKEFGIVSILARAEEGNKTDFINRWLLQQLRMSPLEVEMLHHVFSEVLRVGDQVGDRKRWQADVLFFWARDECNVPMKHLEGPATGHLSPSPSPKQTASAWETEETDDAFFTARDGFSVRTPLYTSSTR